MRIFFSLIIIIIIAASFGACKTESSPPSFCDTACLKDSIKFVDNARPLQPYVYINAKNCGADTITWSFNGAGSNRKMGFSNLLGQNIKINKDFARCYFADTSHAWLLFNDCETGRGYTVKLPFNKSKKIIANSSGLNNIDPKFKISDELVAYSDRGNVFIEDMNSGKKAILTFGQKIELDYDNVHAYIDSLNITPATAWAKVKINNEWKILETKLKFD